MPDPGDPSAAGNESSDPRAALLSRLSSRGPAYRRYRQEGELARGGQGVVLRVWDEDLHRGLAMKLMLAKDGSRGRPDDRPASDRSLGRFLEEAQVTGQLDHPGIVPIHELGVDADGRVYFTMKLVKGETFAAILEREEEGREGWSQARKLGVLLKVCEAMAFAHAKGVVHRDLKPANIMVGRFGEVYVMDFGLARVLGTKDAKDIRIRSPHGPSVEIRSEQRAFGAAEDSPLLTMDGDVIGTPAYMPPEQAEGRIEAVGPPADVYALGAILYHVLAGHMPYVRPGIDAGNYAVLQWVRESPPPSLQDVAPGAPAELVSICEKAMARDPAARYSTTEAMAEDLRAFLEGRVVAAYETGAWAEFKKWVRRNRGQAASLAAAAVLLVAGLVTALLLRAQAVENAARAARNEGEARRQATLAQRLADDLLSLSAAERLEDLWSAVDQLWPPHPEHLEAYDRWLADAAELVDGLEPAPDEDDPGHRARLAALREKALPATEADHRAHPRFAELVERKSRLASLLSAQAVREGRGQVSEPAPDPAALPAAVADLLAEVRQRVGPDRTLFGEEARGLALARLAVDRVEDDESMVQASEALAWALFATGQDEAALEEMDLACSLAPEELRPQLQDARARLDTPVEEAAGARGREAIAALQEEVSRLEEEVSRHRVWRFASEEERWWHTQLTRLVDDIETFADPDAGPWRGSSPQHGWGIERRRAFALEVGERTASGAVASARWREAAERIARNPLYGGIALTPQMGLLPLGPDPDSGLEEFGHLMTGDPAGRDADGTLVVTEETGLVLVLLPGGRSWTGAQGTNPAGRNYDPAAEADEGPVHEVELSPFFLSKYEMTQAQWERLTGRNPSFYQERALSPTLLHPVEQVSWQDAMTWLPRAGLTLPSEAQWEQAARGGTETPWWTGVERESLRERNAANLADRAATRAGASWQDIQDWPDLDDGFAVHAPVGTYSANAFGLHETVGNLLEWCRDGYDAGFYRRGPRHDPVCEPEGRPTRVYRGGCFVDPASRARSANRYYATPTYADDALGVRPARALVP